jgi:hypothetical protein
VKDVPPTEELKWYTHVQSTFQSTSSFNITTGIALNDNKLYVKQKEHDCGPTRRLWGIEMNISCELYLKPYDVIDKRNHMFKSCGMHYISWKYWHCAMLHAKAMAGITTYDMYQECDEGKVDPLWSVRGFPRRYYNPRHRLYPGDKKIQDCTLP